MYPDDYIGYMELIPTVIGVVVTHVYKLGWKIKGINFIHC